MLQIEARNSQRNQNRLKLVRGLKPEGRMLEIGCGKGQFLQMAAAYYTAEGVDISQHAIDSLKANTSFSVRRMDVELGDLPALTYDIIIAFNILEHLQDPGRVIRKIYAALKPGGYLVGSVPYNAALTGRMHTLLTNLFDITHCSTFPPQQWRGLFAGAGFREICFFGEVMAGKSINAYLRHRWWSWFAFNLMFQVQKKR
ncbi:MAG TPA: class I SAM-dependent methyltransferase [Anaerolineaceae bacterium]|nr:class I SAM-dependent methyltransferase [Anaerolineaceae bacterium]